MKITTLNPSPHAARTLFEMLNQIHLVGIHPDWKNASPIARDFATDVDAAINWAITQNAKGWNIYWTVNRVLDGLHKKPKKDQIIAARFAHVDIDPPKDDPAAFDKGAAAYDLVMLNTAPSFIIDSGNGLQAFWRLAEDAPKADVEEVNIALRDMFKADNCQNIDRLMRVPGFMNFPDEKKRQRGRIPCLSAWYSHCEDNGSIHTLDELRAAFPYTGINHVKVEQQMAKPSVRETMHELLTADDLGCDTPSELRQLIEVPKGQDRSNDTFAFVCAALRHGLSSDQIKGVLLNRANPISAHCLDQADPHRAAQRAIDNARPVVSADFDNIAEESDETFAPLTADDLGLGGRDPLRKAINAEDKDTPSKAAYSLAMVALRNGLSEDQAQRLLLTPENRVSQHCLKAANPSTAARKIVDWAVKTIANSPPDEFDDEEPPLGTALDKEDFYFIAPQGSCIYLPTRDLWPTKTIDGAFKSVEREASNWFAENRLAEQMVWAPGEPQIIANRLMVAGSWQDTPGVTVINTYLAGPSLIGGDPAKAGPWVDLIKRVYPNEAEHLIDCFAQRVQRPQDKINHAIVLGGQQGIGKDSMLEPVKEAIGHWNWADISPTHAMGRFNGFLKSIVLRISEARDLGDHDRFAFYDRAKTWMAAPPDVHTIDEKNRREYPAQNVTFVIITTNRQDALHLEPDDRRHFVAWSDLSKEDFSAEFWTEYYDWMNKAGGRAHVAAFLRQRDIASFDPKAPPPKTPAFWAILQAGQSPETLELSDVLEEMGWPDVVCSQAITAEAGIDTLHWFRDSRHAKKVRYRLADCGYEIVLNPDVQDGRWRCESGPKRMIYVRRSISPTDRVKLAANYARGGALF